MATFERVLRAHDHIRKAISQTPILTSSTIDGMVGCKVLFKSEHLQKTGSFKARGAIHNIKIVTGRGTKGVVTHSSGNHGQAVAWAARAAGVKCTVVVPEGTHLPRVSTCNGLAEREGLDFIDPFISIDIIEGQGSLGIELKEQLSSVPPLFVAVGGGGLAAGLSLALPLTPLYLAEPEGKHLTRQLEGNQSMEQLSLPTIADGIRTRLIGEENKKTLKTHKEIHTLAVSESEIRESLLLIWTRLKQHVEPTAAVPLAALIKLSKKSPLPFKEVVLCGGNVDPSFTP